MTTPSSSLPRQGAGRDTSRSFALAGLFACCFTAATVPLGLLDRLPFVGRLLNGEGAKGSIAFAVLTTALWVVLFVLQRFRRGSRERAAVAQFRTVLGKRAAAQSPQAMIRFLLTQLPDAPLHGTLIGRRVAALREAGGADPGQAQGALAARSELDHAHSDVSFGPARALVWALPALGFTGTAAEMAHAVKGLGTSMDGSGGGDAALQSALMKDVIPPLADAFGVTLFALGASVVCHLLLTWADSREQRVLLEVEEVVLEVLAKVPSEPSAASPPSGHPLNGELDQLSQEISQARQAMTASAQQLSRMDLGALHRLDGLAELGPLLQNVDRRLEQIHAQTSKDFILSRLPLSPASPTEELT